MPRPKKTSADILEIWGSEEPITAKNLAERAGVSIRTAWYWIGTLRADGAVETDERTGPRGQGVQSVFTPVANN